MSAYAGLGQITVSNGRKFTSGPVSNYESRNPYCNEFKITEMSM